MTLETDPHFSFFCSWSGGKDCALALYRAVRAGYTPLCLFTMMIENGERSRSHGIQKKVLEQQAALLQLPIRFCNSSWELYTENFLQELRFFKKSGVSRAVFGDIDLEEHRAWVESVCTQEEITAHLPLWKEERAALLKEFLEAGFQAEIVAVKEGVLDQSYLGKSLTYTLLEQFKQLDIDLCGEWGEYHTIVTKSPLFQSPLHVTHGQQVLKSGYFFSDVELLTVS